MLRPGISTQPRTGPRRLASRDEIREAGIEMARHARHELILFDLTLAADLYDDPDFVAAVKTLALARPNRPIRILLGAPQWSDPRPRHLIGLAQRLASRIAIRRLPDDCLERSDAFLIQDAKGYLMRTIATHDTAILDTQGRREARRLRDAFEQLWAHGEIDPELRRLDL